MFHDANIKFHKLFPCISFLVVFFLGPQLRFEPRRFIPLLSTRIYSPSFLKLITASCILSTTLFWTVRHNLSKQSTISSDMAILISIESLK
jgi:hypothetical protein